MPGSHVYTDKVAANMVRLTVNKLIMTKYFSRRNERDFNEGQPIGDTLRVKKANRGTIRDGFAYVGGNINRQYTTIVADQMFGIDVDWDTIEKAIQMERTQEEINENILDPLSAQLAQEADSRCALFAFRNTNMVTGALGTTPSANITFANPQTRMTEKGGLTTAKRAALILTPEMMAQWVVGTPNLISLMNPRSTIDTAFLKGYIGHFFDMDIFTSMSLITHTTGVWATVATGVTITSSGLAGSTLLVSCTTGDTVKRGDKISIAAVNDVNPMTRASLLRLKTFTVMADAVGVGSAMAISISPSIVGPGSPYQNVDALPLAAAVLTLWPGTTMVDATAKTGKVAQSLTNEAFGLVAIDLPMPKSSAFDVVAKGKDTISGTGLEMAIIRWMNPETRAWSTRMDMWIGFGEFLGDNSAANIAGLQ